ncbi:uncharacterized protein [Mytilus edulis]|uniref:uncharacterized protein n=1 Tax=Mytilus edulis TaxID=6550 RepID=UPI0039EFD35C
MANKERENFYRGSTLIVDNTKTSFVDLLELHLSRNNISFEDFITQHQHQIFHLCFNTKKCCRCFQGFNLPNNRILYYPQLEILFDKNAKKPGHNLGNRSDFCCARTKTGITTDVLDITLTRSLLVNFCHDVFWFSCLTLQSQSLPEFLNKNKHHIYHLREPNIPCCQCPPGFISPVAGPLLDLQSWKVLFNLPELPCPLHRMVPSDFSCTVSASQGIAVTDLGDKLTKVLIEQCCPLRQTIERLIQIRNKVQGHASDGRISEADYGGYKLDITSGIMEVAQVCRNEAFTKHSLADVSKRSLDETLCIQYQNMLLEQIQKEKRLEEKIDDIAVQIPTQIELSLNNALRNTIPDMVEQSVQSALKKIHEPNSKLTSDKQRSKSKLLEDTLTLIKCYSSEDTFVESNVIAIALNVLEDKGVIVLTGTAGTGKSRNSLEILRRFSAAHDGYCGIKLNNISEWIEIINDKDCLIVLLGDVFGRTNCIFNAEEEKVFDNIYSMVAKGCVKVICTMRNTIQSDNQVSDIIDRNRIFKQSRFIDLSLVEHNLNREQRRECLIKYCKLNNICVSDTKQFYGDKEVVDPLMPIYLSEQDIYEISKIDINPLMGYPESCFLFASNKKFTRLGVGFFKHPTKSLCNELESLRHVGNTNQKEALQYAILVYMALNEDCLDLHDINIQKFNKVHELLYHKKEFTTKYIRRGLGQLTMRYLRINPNGTYSFQHRSIFEGVLLSYNDIDTESLIPLFHIDFIFEMCRLDTFSLPSGVENEVTMLFDKGMYKMLAKKIITELRKNDSKESFMEKLCSSRIIRNADEYFIDELYKEYNLTKCAISCTVSYLDLDKEYERYACRYDKIYTPSKRTSVSFLTRLLKYSIKYVDNDDAMRHILKLMQHGVDVQKNIYINESHEICFTEAMLQSCAYLNKPRLHMLWTFMLRNEIQFDRETILHFRFGSNRKLKVLALKLLSSTVGTSRLINSNDILAKAIGMNNTDLIKTIFRQQDPSKIDIPLALYNACADGAVSIVQWFIRNFQTEEFDIGKALLVSSQGFIDSPVASRSYHYARINDTRNVVVFLLKHFRAKINNLDTVMHIALSLSRFNICKILMEQTSDYFDAKAILKQISDNEQCYTNSQCLTFVKYLVSVYSCLNVDVLLEMATHNKSFEMVRWIMSITDNEIFYIAWRKHKWIHKEICALQLIHDTEFYKTLDETSIINEELRYGSNKCLRFLFDNYDVRRAENVIVERVCAYGDTNLLQKIFRIFSNLTVNHAMSIAVRKKNLEVVQWLCSNFDVKSLNFESIIKEAVSVDAISIVRYFTEIIDRRYFHSKDILLAIDNYTITSYFKRTLNKEDDRIVIFKWFLQDTNNRYRINEILKLTRMKNKKYTQILFQNCNTEFLHLNIALTAVIRSKDFDSVKILLNNHDATTFDMHLIMEHIWTSFDDKSHAGERTKWLLGKFDPILFDITYILKMTCHDDNLSFFRWLYRSYGLSNLSFESLVIHACKHGAIRILQWIFERTSHAIDHRKVLRDAVSLPTSTVIFFIQNFELDKSDIEQICTLQWRDEKRRLEFKLCIFETYGLDLIDVKSVFDSVCLFSPVQEVNWFMNKVENSLFDFNSAIKEALRGNSDETFTILFEFVKVDDKHEVDMIFTEACRYGNLLPVEFLHTNYGDYLSIPVAIKALCQNQRITQKHFDVFKFLIRFSSPSMLDCQLLMNWACESHNIESIRLLLEFFDPDIFEVRSAICHAFYYLVTEERKMICIAIILELLRRCHCASSDIQAVMETVCNNNMSFFMKVLVLKFGWSSFDVERIMSIALNPLKCDIFEFAFLQSQIDLQSVFVSACEKGDDEALEIIHQILFRLNVVDINRTIHAILDVTNRQEFIIKVIKMLLNYREYTDNKPTDIMSVIRKSYTSFPQASLSKTNNLVLWIHDNCMYSLIDMPEIMLEICRSGDIHSIKYLLNTWNYRNLINTSCIQTAFSGGSIELIEMMINDFPDIPFDKKVAMNNASLSGDISVVQWLFYKYSVRPNRFQFLEPILDLKLALSTFDLNSAMRNACRNGKKDFVQWLLQIYSYETFDMKSCLNEASASGETDLVQWMLAVYDNDIFDIETSFNTACKNGKFRVLEFLIEKFGKAAFDIDTVTTEACGSGNIVLVEWIHKTFDRKLYNIKSAMLMACVNNRSDVVRWILKTFDHSYFNMQMATIVANEWGRIELL